MYFKKAKLWAAAWGGGKREECPTLELEKDEVICCVPMNYPNIFSRVSGARNIGADPAEEGWGGALTRMCLTLV